MARLFVFIVIPVIFSQCYLAGSAKKIEKWLHGIREKVPSRVTFKCCFRMVGRAINVEPSYILHK